MKKFCSTALYTISVFAIITMIAFSSSAQEAGNNENDPFFLLVSDVHLNTFDTLTKYGSDTGLQLWSVTKAKLRSVLNRNPHPQFVLYTGDLPAHYTCDSSCYLPPDQRAAHDKNLEVILTDLRKLVTADKIPLYYLPGNNDAIAGNYFSFADSNKQTAFSLVDETVNPYPAVNSDTPCGESPCLLSQPYPTMGYYSVRPLPGLRLIALNTVILGRNYYPVDGVSQLDAGNAELAWLGSQLAEAAKEGEKVFIAMHIPPGEDAYAYAHNTPSNMWALLPTPQNSWLNIFLGYMDTYQHTVTGIFYAHTHQDEVRRLYSLDSSRITAVAIAAPGITPQHYNNPGFKAIYFDAHTKELKDFITYYTFPGDSVWGKNQYSFRRAYHNKSDNTIDGCLKSLPLNLLDTYMDSIYTVRNGNPTFDTSVGIEVKASH